MQRKAALNILYMYVCICTAKSLKISPELGVNRESVSQRSGALPALIRLPVPPPVSPAPRRDDGQRPAPPPEQAAVVDGPLLGVRQRGVGSVDPHELVGRRALPVDRRGRDGGGAEEGRRGEREHGTARGF